ncbi:transglycosylase family protein [Streptomyces sp. MZ04]|uniref:transglycosylase family protein n=1 Tax=Streptomyces sp. MZ04 TaxID=2559236 RepID=UPI00107EE10E|nr:transglycosylase family protein [Streptomyces sp. MZ04]TGB14143.1 LysM peptidoglycan-binding domain-containing protein [Streptomyces sp. MZ04]
MLSGHGRHRRPRQAPALIVAAGVTGSAIAIPLLGATSASAADTATWDKLAECESGGSWSLDPGNGYYGGLQFSQETWEEYGGLDYAPYADQASRSQQIAVAEKVLAAEGPGAWPSCGVIAGLTKHDAPADVDPGAPIISVPSDESTEPADPSGSTEPDGSAEPKDDVKPSEKPSEKADEKPSEKSSERPGTGDDSGDKNHDEPGDSGESDDSDKSGQKGSTSPAPDSTPSTGAGEGDGSGRHRGDSADDGQAKNGDRDGSGRHASRGDDRAKDGADGTYTVRSGDNLWTIADDLGVQGGWSALYDENKKSVGSDPDLILPGQSLDLGEK